MKLQTTLKRIRKSRGLNLTEAAEEIGISKILLWKYENTDMQPGVTKAKKIADFYGLTIDQLIS